MSMETGQGGMGGEINSVENGDTEYEMADIEALSRGWARGLEEAKADPTKLDGEFWERGYMQKDDIRTMIDAGIEPEDLIRYGERQTENHESLVQYTEKLETLTRPQLLQAYLKESITTIISDHQRNKLFDDDYKLELHKGPKQIMQTLEYRDASMKYEAALERRTLIWNQLRGEK
ncbi:hypothetical protein COY62_03480 [bacterium (Candidatus Howlettbacteria) CG_4_10_14_0_8_um_filter_40_9]|nr:MAG: hypothetical protein COY62_03480 [bacterium (Candidatus Howlettbacteria) CG_4_10_14_0_8_um_filter_40_9]